MVVMLADSSAPRDAAADGDVMAWAAGEAYGGGQWVAMGRRSLLQRASRGVPRFSFPGAKDTGSMTISFICSSITLACDTL
jgi:hypothetical protein